jgi:hypothetical protein
MYSLESISRAAAFVIANALAAVLVVAPTAHRRRQPQPGPTQQTPQQPRPFSKRADQPRIHVALVDEEPTPIRRRRRPRGAAS